VSQAEGRRAPKARGTRLLIQVTAEGNVAQVSPLSCAASLQMLPTVGILCPAGRGNCKSPTPTITIISSPRMQMPHLVLLQRRVLLHAVAPCALRAFCASCVD
jgi:hypothetical protein